MTKYSYIIKLDKAQDAWNWFDACNKTSHGIDWKKRVASEIYKNINGKTEKEAYRYLNAFLDQKYKQEENKIKIFEEYLYNEYNKNFTKACQTIEILTNRPLCCQDFTIFITTFPRGPYNLKEGYIWVYYGWKNAILNFLHEALHFQFIYYWRNNPSSPINKLSEEDFNFIKESLTVILDEDLYPLITTPDKGYDIHQSFRKELHAFWKKTKDFDKLVEFGVEKLKAGLK